VRAVCWSRGGGLRIWGAFEAQSQFALRKKAACDGGEVVTMVT